VTEIDAADGSVIQVVGSTKDHLGSSGAITSNGRYLWVVNPNYGVTQLNASNGALVRVIRPTRNGINQPFGIAYGDGHVWVTSGGNTTHNSKVVELNSQTGSIIRILSEGVYDSTGITIAGQDVVIVNQLNNSVVEFNAENGRFIRLLSARRYQFDFPFAAEPYGGDIWISNGNGAYPMTEIRSSTGSLVRNVRKSRQWLADPYPPSSDGAVTPWDVSVDGRSVWIANGRNVVEISATTGSLIRVVSARRDQLSYAQYLAAGDGRVWVSATGSFPGSVTEIRATTGALLRIIT
jgi:hypothetical protein